MAARQPTDQSKLAPQPMEDPKGRSSIEEIAHKGAQGVQVLAEKLTPAADDSRSVHTPAVIHLHAHCKVAACRADCILAAALS